MQTKNLLLFSGLCAKLILARVFVDTVTENALDGEDNDLSWELDTGPGGPVISFNGTIEKLYEHVDHKFHDYLGKVFDINVLSEPLEQRDEGHSPLEKRTDFSRASYSCYDAPIRASSQRITEGIRYLRAVKGRPRAGPNQKGRVSCSYGAGIWWVNRASTTKTLASFGSIADGAQHLMNRCRFGASVGGITTHPTRWEVQVYRTSC